jgi:hypothetical protein
MVDDILFSGYHLAYARGSVPSLRRSTYGENIGVFSGSSCRTFYSAAMHGTTRSTGGGTKRALPGQDTPIQT